MENVRHTEKTGKNELLEDTMAMNVHPEDMIEKSVLHTGKTAENELPADTTAKNVHLEDTIEKSVLHTGKTGKNALLADMMAKSVHREDMIEKKNVHPEDMIERSVRPADGKKWTVTRKNPAVREKAWNRKLFETLYAKDVKQDVFPNGDPKCLPYRGTKNAD
jgi:hypothetical protein